MSRTIRIIPYVHVDGIPTFRDSDIENIYLMVVEEGKLETVFYDGMIRDMREFVNFFKSPDNHLHIILVNDEIAAIFWINQIEGRACRIHFCGFSKFWKHTIRMGKEALKFLSPHFDLIHGATPVSNEKACKFIQKAGMKPLGIMPDRVYNYYKDRTEDALITYYQTEKEKQYGWW